MKIFSKVSLAVLFLFFAAGQISAQHPEFPPLDKSPADIAYFPSRAAFRFFTKTEEERQADEPLIKVVYSRPQKKGRDIFGELEPFGKVWRAGANENTEIQFFKDAKIGETSVPAGTYSLFIVPEEDKWTLILNRDLDAWGAYSYDEAKDLLRYNAMVQKASKVIEEFSIAFDADEEGALMIMGWDKTYVEIPIRF